MAKLRYHETVHDNITDAQDIVKSLSKAIEAGSIDKLSCLHNLKSLTNKLDKTKYYVERG